VEGLQGRREKNLGALWVVSRLPCIAFNRGLKEIRKRKNGRRPKKCGTILLNIAIRPGPLYLGIMEIRSARVEDIPFVLPMVGKICALHESWDPAKYGFLENPAERYRWWLGKRVDDPRAVFLVADQGEQLAGFLIGLAEEEIPIYRLKEFGFIHDLWVEEEYRHEGVGRQMTMLAVERFGAMGIHQVRLDTAAKNDAARALFTSCGFRPSATEMLLEM
jgi:ribosomal protein S18 acetylase RimI-like enzyme